MAAAELLGDLPAVAEIAQRRAELELVRPPASPAKQALPGRGQHALADAVLQLLLQLVGAHREDHARGTPGRPSGVAAAGSSTSIAASQPQPITEVAKPVIEIAACRAHLRFGAGDDDRRRAHAEGFGEGVVDGDAVDASAAAWHLRERRLGAAMRGDRERRTSRATARSAPGDRLPCRRDHRLVGAAAAAAAPCPSDSGVTSPSLHHEVAVLERRRRPRANIALAIVLSVR